MKKFFSFLSVIFLLAAIFLNFCVIGYGLSAKLSLAASIYFAFMAYTTKTAKKKLIFLRRLMSFFVIAGVVFTSVLCGIILSDIRGDSEEACDYVIVLGAGIWKDRPSQTLSDRLMRACDYLEKYDDSIAIVSGGLAEDEALSEAAVMKRYLISKGISPDRIIEENEAENTNENMKYSLRLINSRGGGSIAVISSDYHIFRSRKLAQSSGFSPVMLSAKTSSESLFLNYLIREAFALVKAYLVFI